MEILFSKESSNFKHEKLLWLQTSYHTQNMISSIHSGNCPTNGLFQQWVSLDCPYRKGTNTQIDQSMLKIRSLNSCFCPCTKQRAHGISILVWVEVLSQSGHYQNLSCPQFVICKEKNRVSFPKLIMFKDETYLFHQRMMVLFYLPLILLSF